MKISPREEAARKLIEGLPKIERKLRECIVEARESSQDKKAATYEKLRKRVVNEYERLTGRDMY